MIFLAHRPGAQPPPPAGQAPFMNGGGNYYNNMYPTQPGYYPALGQAFYPAPVPGGYTGYPPPGRVYEIISQSDFQLSVL